MSQANALAEQVRPCMKQNNQPMVIVGRNNDRTGIGLNDPGIANQSVKFLSKLFPIISLGNTGYGEVHFKMNAVLVIISIVVANSITYCVSVRE